MQLVDAETVHRLSPYPELLDALEAAHRGEVPLSDRSLMQGVAHSDHVDESFLVLPAWAPGRALGVKMATVMPHNPERDEDLPAIHAAYQLFDGRCGAPLAAIDGTALTLRKTAADSALGARLLARADVRSLLMVGAGALAPHLVAAHRAARPSIEHVMVWNRSAARRDALLEALDGEGVTAEAVADLADAVDRAGIVCCATAATQPLIAGEWLRPGQHLDLVGAFSPTMREADDHCVRRAALFVDTRESTVDASGDLVQPLADGVIERGDVRADLFELVTGAGDGRTQPDAITLYKNGGGAHLDLFTAEHIFRRLGNGDAA